MIREAKGFGDPFDFKKNKKDFKRLSKKTLEILGDSGIKEVRKTQHGELKMSEVLEEFTAPYLEETHTYKDRKKVIELAIIAWNVAIIPTHDWRLELTKVVNQLMPNTSQSLRQDMQAILGEMIERKLELFGTINRMIVSYELKETKHSYELLVASTTEQPQKAED